MKIYLRSVQWRIPKSSVGGWGKGRQDTILLTFLKKTNEIKKGFFGWGRYFRQCSDNYSGGSRISLRRGRQPSGGCQDTILLKFPKNCMKLKKIRSPGGGSASPAPPFRSATEITLYCFTTKRKCNQLFNQS